MPQKSRKPIVRRKKNKGEVKAAPKEFNDSNFHVFIYILFGLFVYAFFVNAHICDDAYITFRTIDNFVNGYGLTWNTFERVQAYTHPLWLFLLSFFYFFTREIYLTSLVFSFILSLASVYFIVKKLPNKIFDGIILFIPLLLSKSFIDFTSTGLENPLTFLLLVLFAYLYLKNNSAQRLFLLSIVAGLATTNRLDTILLFLPALIYLLIKDFKFKNILIVLAGFSPFIIWELFSLLYYGFPFPNTAYAKLFVEISFPEKISLGYYYFINSLSNDPITLVIILSVLLFNLINILKKNYTKQAILGLGVLFYLLYIFYIGGDFMSGRFLAAPLVLSLISLSSIKFSTKFQKNKILSFSLLTLMIVIGLSGSNPPPFTWKNYGIDVSIKKMNHLDEYGINDVKAFYYQGSGLYPLLLKGKIEPDFLWAENGRYSSKSDYEVFVKGNIGMFGYYLGPKKKIIDIYSLADPLLSRLPTSLNPYAPFGKWRVGHFYRDMPRGYYETIISGINVIEDDNLKKYYNKLRVNCPQNNGH